MQDKLLEIAVLKVSQDILLLKGQKSQNLLVSLEKVSLIKVYMSCKFFLASHSKCLLLLLLLLLLLVVVVVLLLLLLLSLLLLQDSFLNI